MPTSALRDPGAAAGGSRADRVRAHASGGPGPGPDARGYGPLREGAGTLPRGVLAARRLLRAVIDASDIGLLTHDCTQPTDELATLTAFIGGSYYDCWSAPSAAERRATFIAFLVTLRSGARDPVYHHETDWTQQRWRPVGRSPSSPRVCSAASARRCAIRSAESTSPAPRPLRCGPVTWRAASAPAAVPRPPSSRKRLARGRSMTRHRPDHDREFRRRRDRRWGGKPRMAGPIERRCKDWHAPPPWRDNRHSVRARPWDFSSASRIS